MAKKDLDMVSSGRRERKGVGQVILLICLIIYTLFCALPVILVFVSAFADDMSITQNGFSYFPDKWSMNGMNAVLKYGKQLNI